MGLGSLNNSRPGSAAAVLRSNTEGSSSDPRGTAAPSSASVPPLGYKVAERDIGSVQQMKVTDGTARRLRSPPDGTWQTEAAASPTPHGVSSPGSRLQGRESVANISEIGPILQAASVVIWI